MRDIHADGGAAVHGLHHAGQAPPSGDRGNLILGVGNRFPLRGDGRARRGHQTLGQVFIHGDGRAQIARAGVGNAHEVKGGLHPAVLPAGSVQGKKHNIRHGAKLQHALSEHARALQPPGGPYLL
ncbi:hypothetical protein SDC9_132318 [bioreactor metagenome]|uniref:Uncharacterized protein n=1 Tax=bioreactor metagenome TaxID=1076179 RepID=A0A645D6U3_9ZZZZ